MKSLTKVCIAFLLFAVVACSTQSPVDRIERLQNRLTESEKRMQELYQNDFAYLVEQYNLLDTTVARRKNIHKEMSLVQAYMQQFESEKPNIEREIAYSKQQLSDLKDDIIAGLHDEETRNDYLKTEEAAVKKIVAQLDYFAARFASQKDVIRQLNKQ